MAHFIKIILVIVLSCCSLAVTSDVMSYSADPVPVSVVPLTANSTNGTWGDGWSVEPAPSSLLGLQWKGDPTTLSINITSVPSSVQVIGVQVFIDNEDKVRIVGPTTVMLTNTGDTNNVYIYRDDNSSITEFSKPGVQRIPTFSVQPVQLGRAKLDIIILYTARLSGGDNSTDLFANSSTVLRKLVQTLNVSVVRSKRLLDTIFQFSVYVMLMVVTLTMGAEIKLATVKEVLKKPKAPLIALFCQFVLMPLLAYAIIRMEGYSGGTALGFFTLGCAPGGGPSNMYAHLLGGDMSASVTMTLLSTLLSVGTLPLWLYTLGTTFPSDGARTVIPFVVIAQTLAVLIVPLAIGILIQYKFPKIAEILRKCLKVLMIIVVLFLFIFGIFSNLYLFEMFDIKVICIGAFLPYGGFLLGGGIALACRCDWTLVKTISIETGLQNAGIPFFMIQAAFSSPDLELATMPVVSSIIMTPIPLLIATFSYLLYNHCRHKTATLRVDSMECVASSDIEANGDEKDTSSKELLPFNKVVNSDIRHTNSEKPPEYRSLMNRDPGQ